MQWLMRYNESTEHFFTLKNKSTLVLLMPLPRQAVECCVLLNMKHLSLALRKPLTRTTTEFQNVPVTFVAY